MTIQELIKALSCFSPNLPVVIQASPYQIPMEAVTVYIPDQGIIAEGPVVIISSNEYETN